MIHFKKEINHFFCFPLLIYSVLQTHSTLAQLKNSSNLKSAVVPKVFGSIATIQGDTLKGLLHFNLRLNLLYLKDVGTELIFPASSVIDFWFTDQSDKSSHRFISLLYRNKGENAFFELIYPILESKAVLLYRDEFLFDHWYKTGTLSKKGLYLKGSPRLFIFHSESKTTFPVFDLTPLEFIKSFPSHRMVLKRYVQQNPTISAGDLLDYFNQL